VKIGDIVSLASSGGASMTIVAVHDDLVTCAWFDCGGKAGRGSFPALALRKVVIAPGSDSSQPLESMEN
jgi:uncharacterized protein YodC (DUF2158 family)